MNRSSRPSTLEMMVAMCSASSTPMVGSSKMSVISLEATALTREPVAEAHADQGRISIHAALRSRICFMTKRIPSLISAFSCWKKFWLPVRTVSDIRVKALRKAYQPRGH
jgi:hypothetical protein